MRGRPRLHRRAGLRRLLASASPPPPTAPTRSPACWPSPSRCRRAPRARDAPDRRAGLRRAGLREPFAGRRRARGRRGARGQAPARRAARRRPRAARSAGVRRVPRRRPRRRGCCERYADAAPYLSSLLGRQEPGTAGVPSTTATSLTSLGTALPPGAHGLVGFTSRIPGTDRLLNALAWDKQRRPASSGSRTRRRSPGCGSTARRVTVDQQARVPRQRADRRGAPRRGRSSAPTGSGSGSPRPSRRRRERPSPDLPLRRRPRLDRPPLRRRLDPVAPAARDGRRRGRAAARVAARRRRGCSWSPTTAWSTPRRASRVDVDERAGAARRRWR